MSNYDDCLQNNTALWCSWRECTAWDWYRYKWTRKTLSAPKHVNTHFSIQRWYFNHVANYYYSSYVDFANRTLLHFSQFQSNAICTVRVSLFSSGAIFECRQQAYHNHGIEQISECICIIFSLLVARARKMSLFSPIWFKHLFIFDSICLKLKSRLQLFVSDIIEV